MQGEGSSIFVVSPTFSSYSSTRFAEIAAKVSEEFYEDREELGLENSDFFEKNSKLLVIEEEQIQIPSVNEDHPCQEEKNNDSAEEDDDDDFEFAVLSRDPDASPISADEMFSNGQIKPIYPLFNRDLLFSGGEDDFTKLQNGSTIRLPLRKLLIEEREPSSSSSSESDELEALPEGTYCVWTPKQVQERERCKKSNSTGNSSKRWRFRDLLNRSNSDGKDTFVFLTPSTKTTNEKKAENAVERNTEISKERRDSRESKKLEVSKERRDSRESKRSEVSKEKRDSGDAGKLKSKGVSGEGSASPHEAHYVRNRVKSESDRRRSYLPYRKDLVGIFANVNGLNRTLRPF